MSKYMHEMIISICTLGIIYTVLIRIARYNEPERGQRIIILCVCVCVCVCVYVFVCVLPLGVALWLGG